MAATTGSTTGATTAPPKADEQTGAELTLAQYNQKLEDLGKTVAALTAEMQKGMADAKAAGSKEAGLPKLQAAIQKFVDGSKVAIDDLAKVKPPADLAKFHSDVITWNRKVIAATAPMIEASASSDTTKLETMNKELQTDMSMMLDDYKADLIAAHYDYDAFMKGGKLVKK